jgi:catechol 2,3-dioxygenase-like lactoylglutathione lyase family enzyme
MSFGLIHHVEVNVSNLEKSRVFWSWLLNYLGWQKHQDWPEGFSYIKEKSYIVFVQTKDKYLEAGYNRCRTGLNHLAFHAENAEEVTKLVAELQERHITILYPENTPHAGEQHHHAVYFEDPDRIKVELTTA